MIKANVILDYPIWQQKIKKPYNYIKSKLTKLSKASNFKNKKQEFTIFLTNNKNQLIGSILLDFLDDGLSAVYSFYDPDFIKNGIGKYLILKAIDKVKETRLRYLYLGYWIEGSDKMSYKGSSNSLEIFNEGTWKLKP